MNSSKGWWVFLPIITLTLIYGLFIRDKDVGSSDGADVTLEKPLSSELAIRHNYDPREPDSIEIRRELVLMGSQFIFIVDAPEKVALEAITKAANAIKELESQLTSWKPGSDVYLLNENAGNIPVKVGKHTISLLKLSKTISVETEGAFDITVGSIWDLWPFREANKRIPTVEEVRQLLPLVDANSIQLDELRATAFLPKAGMKVNFGAIGKGYAAEVAIRAMKDLGIKRAAVSAGGDLFLLGRKNSGPWKVSVEHPRWPGKYIAQFYAGDVAIATSGDANQYLVWNGKRYGHIVDPNKGFPVDYSQSVTIATKSASVADAYATAVYVMGYKKGLEWVEKKEGVEALIIDGDGQRHQSTGWKKFTEKGVIL